MGKPTGFLDYERKNTKAETPLQRIRHFHEFKTSLPAKNSRNRADAAWTAACRSARTAACSQA